MALLPFGTGTCMALLPREMNIAYRSFFVLSATTGLSCLVSHILFPIFQTVSKYCTHVSSPVKGLVDFGNMLSNCLTVCMRNLFCSPINRWGTHLAVICRTFKILFGMKCTLNSNMQTALALWRSYRCICHHFSMIL